MLISSYRSAAFSAGTSASAESLLTALHLAFEVAAEVPAVLISRAGVAHEVVHRRRKPSGRPANAVFLPADCPWVTALKHAVVVRSALGSTAWDVCQSRRTISEYAVAMGRYYPASQEPNRKST